MGWLRTELADLLFRSMTPHLRFSCLVPVLVMVVLIAVYLLPESEKVEPDAAYLTEKNKVLPTDVISKEEKATFQRFADWMRAYRGGNRDPEFIRDGRALAKLRGEAMLSLVKMDADAALDRAIGYADYSVLPSSIQALVEEPFTMRGDTELLAICDDDQQTPEYRHYAYDRGGVRFKVGPHRQWRTGLSKLDVPLQGIKLEGWMAIQPQVFDRVEGRDADWAIRHLPNGNPDANSDFLTGDPMDGDPVIALSGGRVYRFANETSLSNLETELKELDRLPGGNTGSSVLFEPQVQAKGFPIDFIKESRLQLLTNETTGEKTILLIRVGFPDDEGNSNRKEVLDERLNGEASEYFSAYSYGQTTLAATISEKIYQVSKDSSEYASDGDEDEVDEDDLFNEAVVAYRADVKDVDPFEDFDIVGLFFPRIEGIGWAGLATVGGAKSRFWLNGAVSIDTIVHELGHNFGLLHSNFWKHTHTDSESINPVDPTGENVEYGDDTDVMGDGDVRFAHFNMAYKRYLGWLQTTQIKVIDSAEDNGVTRVYQFDHEEAASSNVQGIQIRKGDNEFYWVGLRKNDYIDTTDDPYILWEREEGASRNQTWLIDPFPENLWGSSHFFDPFGKTYSDKDAGVHITPLNKGGSLPDSYVDFGVYFGDTEGNSSPTVSIEFPPELNARESLSIKAQASDTDGDDLYYIWDIGDSKSYPNTSDLTTVFEVGGDYEITIAVSDLKGGYAVETVQVYVNDPIAQWSSRDSNTENDFLAIANNDEYVVIGGRGNLLRSTSGVQWTDQSPVNFEGVTIWDICWTGSKFVAVGSQRPSEENFDSYPVIYSSPDGVDWIKELELHEELHLLNSLWGVASNLDGSIVIAVGFRGQVFRSVNGEAWEKIDLGFREAVYLNGVTHGNGYFIFAGWEEFPIDGRFRYLFRSTDGITWEDLIPDSDITFPYWPEGIEFLNDRFYLIGDGSSGINYFSEDSGETWILFSGEGYLGMESMAFGEGLYIGTGNSSSVGPLSVDGENWERMKIGPKFSGRDITHYNDSFITVGSEGKIWQSIANLTGFEPWIDEYYRGQEAGELANPDSDWASNLFEWGLGSLPNDSKSVPAFPILRMSSDGHLVISFPRLSKVPGAEFVLDVSLDLKTWHPLATVVEVDTEQLLELRSVDPVSSHASFYRIKVLER